MPIYLAEEVLGQVRYYSEGPKKIRGKERVNVNGVGIDVEVKGNRVAVDLESITKPPGEYMLVDIFVRDGDAPLSNVDTLLARGVRVAKSNLQPGDEGLYVRTLSTYDPYIEREFYLSRPSPNLLEKFNRLEEFNRITEGRGMPPRSRR